MVDAIMLTLVLVSFALTGAYAILCKNLLNRAIDQDFSS
jgi:hypothetical protein